MGLPRVAHAASRDTYTDKTTELTSGDKFNIRWGRSIGKQFSDLRSVNLLFCVVLVRYTIYISIGIDLLLDRWLVSIYLR